MQYYANLAIFYIIMNSIVSKLCECGGSFEIKLISVSEITPIERFQPEFRICLKHFERHISHNGVCTFGEVTLDAKRLYNGTKVDFSFFWPESFTLIIEVWKNKGSVKKLVFHDGFQKEGIGSGKHWIEEELRGSDGFWMHIAYRIVCFPNYYGSRCNISCKPISNSFGHFQCLSNGTLVCAAGWEGKNCDIATARCEGCVNGFCDRPGSCRCKTGWTGPNCDQCIPYPGCKHGTCKLPNQCICEDGWGGHFCSEDLNYCTRHLPCKNGALCRNTGHGKYTCNCSEHFTGKNCEIRKEICTPMSCLNGGTCVNTSGNFACACLHGFKGQRCEHKVETCMDAPCRNGGTCLDARDGFICSCPREWVGIRCERHLQKCQKNTCLNGGRCIGHLLDDDYECICSAGFTGNNCEFIDNECKLFNPCLNGGRCIDEGNNYKCQCLDGFSGTLCQTSLTSCRKQPCKNGAECVPLEDGSYQCKCRDGFTGPNCEFSYEIPCLNSPCRNGGTCYSFGNNYRCACTPCFSDINCSTRRVECSTDVLEAKLNATSSNNSGSEDESKLKQFLLMALSFISALVLLSLLIILCRRRLTKSKSYLDAVVQNNINSRKQEYLCKCKVEDTVISVVKCETKSCECSRQNKSDEDRPNGAEYELRYDIEPSDRRRPHSEEFCAKQLSKECRIPYDENKVSEIPLSISARKSEGIYEEIDEYEYGKVVAASHLLGNLARDSCSMKTDTELRHECELGEKLRRPISQNYNLQTNL